MMRAARTMAMSNQVIPEYPAGPSARENGAGTIPSRFFVASWIAATLMLLAAMIGLMLYRALTQRAPQKALVVQGDDRWAGVSIVIEGGTLREPMDCSP